MGTGKRLGRGYLEKALIVVPPVGAEDLQRRWQEFQEKEGARLRPFTVPGPLADPHALVLAFRDPRWTVIGADRRTEWSYGAALRQAVADLRERAAAPLQAPRRSVTRRLAAGRYAAGRSRCRSWRSSWSWPRP